MSTIPSRGHDNSPNSPRKGGMKKLATRENSLTRSPLKVRWKDMIEISNVIEDGYDDYDEPSEEEAQLKEQQLLEMHRNKMEDSDDESDDDDFDGENDMNFEDEDDDDYEYDEDDENVNSGLEMVKSKLNKTSEYENSYISNVKLSNLVEPVKDDPIDFVINRVGQSNRKISKTPSLTSDVIITPEKRNYTRKYEEKSEQFNLKPLHSTGND